MYPSTSLPYSIDEAKHGVCVCLSVCVCLCVCVWVCMFVWVGVKCGWHNEVGGMSGCDYQHRQYVIDIPRYLSHSMWSPSPPLDCLFFFFLLWSHDLTNNSQIVLFLFCILYWLRQGEVRVLGCSREVLDFFFQSWGEVFLNYMNVELVLIFKAPGCQPGVEGQYTQRKHRCMHREKWSNGIGI